MQSMTAFIGSRTAAESLHFKKLELFMKPIPLKNLGCDKLKKHVYVKCNGNFYSHLFYLVYFSLICCKSAQ
jgi:hypothetical protein